MGKFGLTIEELEQEFRERLAELTELVARSDVAERGRTEAALSLAYYLVEVVKRWKSPGITIDRVQLGAIKALERRIRQEGAAELERLVEGRESNGRDPSEGVSTGLGETVPERAPAGSGEIDAGGADPSVGGSRELASGVSGGDRDHSPPPEGEAGGGEPVSRSGDRRGAERAGGGSSRAGREAGFAEGEDSRGGEVTIYRTCKRCGAGMPPESESKLPPSAKRCPACGWDPSEPSPGVPSPARPEPVVPATGRSFSEGKVRRGPGKP